MKFGILVVHNFLTVGDGVVKLNDRGLNVIQGVNVDDSSASSNGAGKSSVVDALCWCLYGVTARGAKGDAVVNRTESKDCYVRLSMSNGATHYQVDRFRKHREFKNQLRIKTWSTREDGTPGEMISLDRATEADSQSVLEKILGCSYEVFIAAVYAGQEVMPDLPRLTDRDLKRLIEEAAGMQRVERAYLLSRDRMNTAKTLVGTHGVYIVDLEGRLARADELLVELDGKFRAWEEGRIERIEVAGRRYAEAVVLLKRATEALAPFRAAESTSLAKLKELKDSLAGYEHAKKLAASTAAAAVAADRAINRAGLVNVAKLIEARKKTIADAVDHMKEPCTECGKPHTPEDLEAYLVIQTEALAALKTNAAVLAAQVKAQIAAHQAAQKAAEEAWSLIPDVTHITAEIDGINERIRLHREAASHESRLNLDRKNAADVLARVEAEANPHLSATEVTKRQRAEVEKSLVERRLDQAEAMRLAEIAEAVVKTFGPAGVRAQILDTVTPYLNARTADYLSVLSDGNIEATWTTLTRSAKGDLKEKFSIDVTNATGAENFIGLSGGEKRKVRLATALALQDLVASRATQPIELWIGDEVDDALDPAGPERLMTILERKARERGTVLVISHNDLKDWADQITTVRKEGGKATIEGSLCE